MSKAKKRHRRHDRHRANAKLRHPKSVRKHAKYGGRTGGIQSKKTPSTKAWPMVWIIANP